MIAVCCAAIVSPAVADGKGALRALDADDCSGFAAEINDGLDHDEALAYFLAGTLYDATDCVAPDYRRAVAFYRRAVELGNEEARNFLGMMYGLGRGVDQDYAIAERWFSGAQTPPATAEDDDANAAWRTEVRGYAHTVTQLARSKVQYPRAMNGELVYVKFHSRSGEVTFTVDGRDGHRDPLARPSIFTEAITEAYAYAVKLAPRTDAIDRKDLVFETPWKYMRRMR